MPSKIKIIEANIEALDDNDGDVLVLTAFTDERPLQGLAGLVDWRLSGTLSRWLLTGFAAGSASEQVLTPSNGLLSHDMVLLMGLGPRTQHRMDRANATAKKAVDSIVDLNATRMTCGLFGLNRLVSPLERSVPELISTLTANQKLDCVQLVVDSEHVEIVNTILRDISERQ